MPYRLSALPLVAFLFLGWAAAAAKATLTLNGTVTSESGKPITNANVFIYTAGPRVGVGFL